MGMQFRHLCCRRSRGPVAKLSKVSEDGAIFLCGASMRDFHLRILAVAGLASSLCGCIDLENDLDLKIGVGNRNAYVQEYAIHTRDFYQRIGYDKKQSGVIALAFTSFVPDNDRKKLTREQVRNIFACSISEGRPNIVRKHTKLVNDAIEVIDVGYQGSMRAGKSGDINAADEAVRARYGYDVMGWHDRNRPRIEAAVREWRAQECATQYQTRNFIQEIGENLVP
ncbi:hypothetical protein MWN34_10690 [Ancylobacter sp. 6x-1]|uniref:Uncharacterized protein n=1 Tax=Ancylobacter crimeensis TaxID=2579147 RepID=A0ABT0DBV3_9HYPH|nr:hypothetical protein [Ancylobacter crimeensis]MCK0197379.1 hypothetical protein [Ancylobacter crimeensis]